MFQHVDYSDKPMRISYVNTDIDIDIDIEFSWFVKHP